MPTPDLAAGSHRFVLGGEGIGSDLYISAANEILAGKLRVFALEYFAGEKPRWNLDPKTGREAPLVFGKALDYRDESLVGDIKYLWEPNRHLHLVTLAQAWRLSGEQRYLDGIRCHIESWLDQCPYPMGPNWTSSLELAIRLINWSFVWQLIGGQASPLFSNAGGRLLRARWLESIYRHMHFVRGNFSKYSSANNHLIGEAAGLFIAATMWPHWRESKRWARQAGSILEREILLQNCADGVNREQAISYQQFVLDFLLMAALAGRANGHDFSERYWKRIEAMMEFLASIMDARGNVPMIGDADDGFVVGMSQEQRFCPYRSLLATGTVLFRRGEFKVKAGWLDDKTRWLLGPDAETVFKTVTIDEVVLPIRRAFPEGGYHILGSDFETDREIRLVVDSGPLGYLSIAAHGHADALAFTLSVGGHEFLIDPGTFAYHTEQAWRDYFRGTAAHNTVVVDEQNQSTIGGNFMWLQKANSVCEIWESKIDSDRFAGWHDGYMQLNDRVLHRREIKLNKSEQ
ncbi:MAG TPA: alginate lyase family protein, partial [Aestuariivirgaceae bacterium]|nr:alginate lyase family protein [Aestuariivirgaceae bacterium]